MPNHITNRLRIEGPREQITALAYFMDTTKEDKEGSEFDFNQLIPMPEELNIVSGGYGSTAMMALYGEDPDGYAWKNQEDCQAQLKALPEKTRQEAIKLGKQYKANKDKYGYATWYPWALANWGTKWNAYSVNHDGTHELYSTIWFDTAWSGVPNLILQLSAKFPELEIEYAYADEDMSSNTGSMTFKGGEVFDQYYPESGSQEGYNLYFDVCGGEEDYILIEGEYRYIDDVEEGVDYKEVDGKYVYLEEEEVEAG
jgi:hypothetical protein